MYHDMGNREAHTSHIMLYTFDLTTKPYSLSKGKTIHLDVCYDIFWSHRSGMTSKDDAKIDLSRNHTIVRASIANCLLVKRSIVPKYTT